MFKIKHHLLYVDDKQIAFKQTPNGGGHITPIGVVYHHTASGDASATGDISWLTQRAAKASAHFIIAYDGTITQLMECNRKTWHAGRSSYRGRKGLNSCTIGIELDNPGPLTKRFDGQFDGIGGPYDAALVVEAHSNAHGNHFYWKRFSNAQIEAATMLGIALADTYSIAPGWLTTHYEISPRRKIDPGPHFPIKRIRGLVAGRDDDRGMGESVHKTVTPDTAAAAAPKPRKPWEPAPLYRGNTGKKVRWLQRKLCDKGYHVTVDGHFGQFTEDAVIAFQRHKGLATTGVVNTEFYVALDAAEPLPKNNTPVATIIKESRTSKLALGMKTVGAGMAGTSLFSVDKAITTAQSVDDKVAAVKDLSFFNWFIKFGQEHVWLILAALLIAGGAYLLYIRIQATRNRKIG